jgi:hypothetical protein
MEESIHSRCVAALVGYRSTFASSTSPTRRHDRISAWMRQTLFRLISPTRADLPRAAGPGSGATWLNCRPRLSVRLSATSYDWPQPGRILIEPSPKIASALVVTDTGSSSRYSHLLNTHRYQLALSRCAFRVRPLIQLPESNFQYFLFHAGLRRHHGYRRHPRSRGGPRRRHRHHHPWADGASTAHQLLSRTRGRCDVRTQVAIRCRGSGGWE